MQAFDKASSLEEEKTDEATKFSNEKSVIYVDSSLFCQCITPEGSPR